MSIYSLYSAIPVQPQIVRQTAAPALGSGQVLHRMEGKAGKIRNAAGALSLSDRAKAVRAVSHHGHPADLALDGVGRPEQGLLLLHNGENSIITRPPPMSTGMTALVFSVMAADNAL